MLPACRVKMDQGLGRAFVDIFICPPSVFPFISSWRFGHPFFPFLSLSLSKFPEWFGAGLDRDEKSGAKGWGDWWGKKE